MLLNGNTQSLRELFALWALWAQSKLPSIDFEKQPPFFGAYERTVFYDPATLVPNTPIEFIQNVPAPTLADGTSAFSLAGTIPQGIVVGVLGMYLRVPDVTADRAGEDATQLAKAILGDGRLSLRTTNNLRMTVPATAGMNGQDGFTVGEGAGAEFARESRRDGLLVATAPMVYTAEEGATISLQHVFDVAAFVANGLAMDVKAGLILGYAGPGLTGGN
jgi:hypothetical protein